MFQLSTDVRNRRLNAVEWEVGTDAILRIRSGSQPGNCGSPDVGDLLAEISFPTNWMKQASNGVKEKDGTWTVPAATATGIGGHFRLYDGTGTVCHIQGNVSGDGEGGDMEIDNVNIVLGQAVTVSAFTLTDGNA